jgi:hypothetical protein
VGRRQLLDWTAISFGPGPRRSLCARPRRLPPPWTLATTDSCSPGCTSLQVFVDAFLTPSHSPGTRSRSCNLLEECLADPARKAALTIALIGICHNAPRETDGRKPPTRTLLSICSAGTHPLRALTSEQEAQVNYPRFRTISKSMGMRVHGTEDAPWDDDAMHRNDDVVAPWKAWYVGV